MILPTSTPERSAKIPAAVETRGSLSRSGGRRAVIAILAAYALLFQAFIGCVTSEEWLSPINLALSASLCDGAQDGSPQPHGPQQHDRADCCVLCLTPGLAGADAVASAVAPTRAGITVRAAPMDVLVGSPPLPGYPCQPRAPPAFA